MYSCERLARGPRPKGGVIQWREHPPTEMPEVPKRSLRELRNQDAYSVTLEKDPNRPVGKLYKSRCLNE